MAKMAGLSSLDLHIEQAYTRGSVPASDGTAMSLAPHTIDRAAGEALRDLAIAEGARRTIEVGLALGLSALYLCRAVSERAGRHVAVDPFQQESWGGAGLRTLRDAGAEQIVEVIEEESQLALPGLVAQGKGVRLRLHRRRPPLRGGLPRSLLHDPLGQARRADRRRRSVDAVGPHGCGLRRAQSRCDPGAGCASQRLSLAPASNEPRTAGRLRSHGRAAPAPSPSRAGLGCVRGALLRLLAQRSAIDSSDRGGVVQWSRTSAFQAEDRGFKSRRPYLLPTPATA